MKKYYFTYRIIFILSFFDLKREIFTIKLCQTNNLNDFRLKSLIMYPYEFKLVASV